MGFGSYDESEQQNQEVNADDSEGVSVHENDHDGEVTFESDASTDDLVDRLADIKDDDE
ncbi:DUF5786 family protein [Haloplanus sp. GCM10025708]|uniref:DUF5786 family protein n=1 Tax=Haloferacaceae TaxID=1644056 RepID=UPI003605BE9E